MCCRVLVVCQGDSEVPTIVSMSKAVIKSGYPDYPKSGFIRTILETEIRSLKTGKPVLGFLVGRALF